MVGKAQYNRTKLDKDILKFEVAFLKKLYNLSLWQNYVLHPFKRYEMCELICLYFNVTSGYDFEYKNKLNSIPSTNAVEISRKLVTKCVFIILSCIYFVSA